MQLVGIVHYVISINLCAGWTVLQRSITLLCKSTLLTLIILRIVKRFVKHAKLSNKEDALKTLIDTAQKREFTDEGIMHEERREMIV